MQFGTPYHFCTDYVNFMAIPHYRYLVLKMPTEKGVLTLRGNVYAAYTCEDDSFRVAEAHNLSIRMTTTMLDARKTSADHLEIPKLEAPCKNTKFKEHKVIQLVDGDPSKTALIGANLDPK